MDSKKKTSLDDLLNQVRQGTPVMEEQEAMDFIRNTGSLPLPKRVKIKPIIMTSIVLTIGLFAGIWMMPAHVKDAKEMREVTEGNEISGVTEDSELTEGNEVNRLNEGNLTSGKRETSDGDKESIFEHTYAPVDTPTVDSIGLRRETFSMLIDKDEKEVDGDSVRIKMVTESRTSDSPYRNFTCNMPEGALKLEASELKPLGIILKGNNLLYQMDHTAEGKIQISFNGIGNVNDTRIIGSNTSKQNQYLLPLAVQSCKGEWIYLRGSEPTLDEISKGLAIQIDLEDGNLIFWYERSEALLKLLPLIIQNALLENPNLYSIAAEDRTIGGTGKAVNDALESHGPLVELQVEPSENLIDLGGRISELGIHKNEKGIELKRGGISYLRTKNQMQIESERHFSEDDFRKVKNTMNLLPMYITDAHFYQNHPIQLGTVLPVLNEEGNKLDLQGKFLFDKWALVPVAVGYPDMDTVIFWYAYNDALKNILTPAERNKIENRISMVNTDMRYVGAKAQFVNVDLLFKDEKASAEALNAIEPAKEVLNKLGVRVLEDGKIEVRYLYDEDHKLMVNEFSKSQSTIIEYKNEFHLDSATKTGLIISKRNLVSITDDLGGQPRLTRWQEGGIKLNELIPVRVRSGQIYSLDDKINQRWRPDIIIWYEATPEILSILESEGDSAEIGEVTSTEVKPTEVAKPECRYTEICRNKPGVFNSHSVYPNPASGYSNFAWTATETAAYSITLYALNGQKVRSFENLNAVIGKNSYQMDISSLPPGVYMLILRSAKGDEIHERLVVKE
ncbi:MAG: T9SS type A sorting domain-containing protein [Bacteroidetes bacterium]|nr:T9SS type A sorting domain-containing protein [Bacteroidota bacterium]